MVELHPDEGQLSSEDSAGPHDVDKLEDDQGLKIRRTVTQVRVLWQLEQVVEKMGFMLETWL